MGPPIHDFSPYADWSCRAQVLCGKKVLIQPISHASLCAAMVKSFQLLYSQQLVKLPEHQQLHAGQHAEVSFLQAAATVLPVWHELPHWNTCTY